MYLKILEISKNIFVQGCKLHGFHSEIFLPQLIEAWGNKVQNSDGACFSYREDRKQRQALSQGAWKGVSCNDKQTALGPAQLLESWESVQVSQFFQPQLSYLHPLFKLFNTLSFKATSLQMLNTFRRGRGYERR